MNDVMFYYLKLVAYVRQLQSHILCRLSLAC